ncbi:MAG: acyl-CoA thioesterase [Ignavibacteria bacterium]|jgi:acyl-CoA thioester hydrolase
MKEHSHISSIRVRYADTDKMGIVYNGNYLTYFEIGRTELLRSMGLPYSKLEEQGIQFPVIEAHVEYKVPAHYDEILDIRATCSLKKGLLLHIAYEITRGTTLLTTGYTIHPFIGIRTGKPMRPPAFFMDIWESRESKHFIHKEIRL